MKEETKLYILAGTITTIGLLLMVLAYVGVFE